MLALAGDMLYRARWFVLLVGAVAVLTAALFGTGLFGRLTDGGFEDPTSPSAHAHALLNRRLGGVTPDLILLLHSDTLRATDPDFATAAMQLLDTLQAQPHVASVISYYATHSPRFLSRDGHATFAAIQLAGADQTVKDHEYRTVLPFLTSPTLQVSVGGTLAVNAAITAQASADLEHAEVITFPLVGLLLILVFTGVVAARLPFPLGGAAILGGLPPLPPPTGGPPVSGFAPHVGPPRGTGLAL